MGMVRRACVVLVAVVYATIMTAPAIAQGTTGVVTGTVRTAGGSAIAGAEVALIGPTRMTQRSDAAGNFNFPAVPSGFYTLQVTRAGFTTYRDQNVAAFIGETVTVNVTLVASSFSSLQTIASVSTRAPGVAPINTSTAAINTINSSVFSNQGLQQVTAALNQTPGIFVTPYQPGNGNPSNGFSPASTQTPQIRGALPYETESLIDGHPVSVGSAGTFSPNLINPFLLDNVEVVKGPGSMPAEINYAINGTVNYRTLEPTAGVHFGSMFSTDKWGGISAGLKVTGETTNHKVGYAFGYVTYGAPGPLQNFSFNGSQLPLDSGPPGGPYFVNGHQLAMVGAPVGEGIAPKQFAPYAGMGLVFVEPLVGCCFSVPTGYHSTSELGKILFNFSNNTSLKLSYLGGQSVNGNGDVGAYDTSLVSNTGLPAFSFQPCGTAGAALTCNPFATGTPYSCTSPSGPGCGKAIPFDLTSLNGEGYTWNQQNLFQGEFRTTLGQTGTVLARYYTGSLNTYAVLGSSTSLNTTLQSAFGTLPLCPIGATFDPAPPSGTNPGGLQCTTSGGTIVAPTNTTFNGQSVNLRTVTQANLAFTNDTMSGETLEVQEQLGDNTFTLAYDRSLQNSSLTETEPSVGITIHSPVKGSQQTIQTISLRGTVILKPKLLLNFGDYLLNYNSRYSLNAGETFNNSSHTYNAPRAALTWQPSNDTIYRLAAGASIAPPYITLVSSGGPTWSQIIGGVPAAGWMQDANNGAINAETAFGYDLGADHRIARDTAVSVDFYLTQLHNLFLTQTNTVTGAAAAGCPNQPCVVSKTTNLGQARYEGIELGLNHVPLYGFGWEVQGSLQRAFTYNLPRYFYCAGSTNPATGVTTPPGPGCINNTNLAVLPEINFGGVATGISGAPNGIPGARVPYASGYGDVSWLGHYGQYYNLNVTYYGSNNVYNAPAFAVMGATVRFNLGNYGTKLQFSIDNFTGAYNNPYVGFFNGIPLPLVKGATQTSLLTGEPLPIGAAPSPAGNYGPTTYRFILTQNL